MDNTQQPIAPEKTGVIPGLDKLMQQRTGSPEQEIAQKVEPIQAARQVAPQQIENQISTQATQLGMNMPATSAALSSKYKSLADRDLRRLQSGVETDAAYNRAKTYSELSGFMNAKEQLKTSAYQANMQAYQSYMQARGQMISTFMGLAGSIGGAYLGGAGGAAVGGMAGKSAGAAGGPNEMQPNYSPTSGLQQPNQMA